MPLQDGTYDCGESRPGFVTTALFTPTVEIEAGEAVSASNGINDNLQVGAVSKKYDFPWVSTASVEFIDADGTRTTQTCTK
jgi:hypothetical protein